jgi:nicotinamidase/pyrazinamidase
LWPVHCVQYSFGAELVNTLQQNKIDKIIHKGTRIDIDSYSAFFDNEHLYQTDLHEYLQHHHITTLTIMGLATDYCVKFTVLDALHLGYNVTVIKNGCKGINLKSHDVDNAFLKMEHSGAKLI